MEPLLPKNQRNTDMFVSRKKYDKALQEIRSLNHIIDYLRDRCKHEYKVTLKFLLKSKITVQAHTHQKALSEQAAREVIWRAIHECPTKVSLLNAAGEPLSLQMREVDLIEIAKVEEAANG